MFALLLALGAPEPDARVAVDWSGVPDSVVDRCGLRGLENLLVQQLIEAGFAVVNAAGEDDVSARLWADELEIEVEATAAGMTRHALIAVPETCESTIQFDIVAALVDLVRVVAEARPRYPVIADPEALEVVEEIPGDWTVLVGAAVVLPGAANPLGHLAVQGHYQLNARWRLGLGSELNLGHYAGILVLEPVVAAEAGVLLAESGDWRWSLGVEGAVVWHVFDSDEISGTHTDGRIGVVAEVHNGLLGLQLMPYARLVPVEHVLLDQVAYESRAWGVLLRVAFLFLAP